MLYRKNVPPITVVIVVVIVMVMSSVGMVIAPARMVPDAVATVLCCCQTQIETGSNQDSYK